MNQGFFQKYPSLRENEASITAALDILGACFQNKGVLLAAGNGGSCADADHIAGELIKGFLLPRRLPAGKPFPGLEPRENDLMYAHLQQGLPVIPLAAFSAFMTAYINDEDAALVYAQLIHVFGKEGDVFLGISTSGNSSNILYAAAAAKAKGLRVLALTGRSGGRLAGLADVSICVPADTTPDIQELHLPVYHYLCAALELRFFGKL